MAVAFVADTRRNRLHAAVELRTEPRWFPLYRFTARRDRCRRRVRIRARAAFYRCRDTVRRHRGAVLERHGTPRGALAVRRRLDGLLSRARGARCDDNG